MHRIFSGDGWLCVPGHPQIRTRSLPESASPAAASRPDYPVHPVHRCSIYSPSRWICPVAGGGRPARRQTGVSQRGQAGFQRSRPPDTPHLTIGTTPPGARASRPHAVPSVAAQFPCDVAADRPAGENRMGPAEAEAGRRCRLIPVEEMAEAARGFVRAGTPALPGGLHQSSCLKQNLGSRDAKPVQEIEKTGVGEELTTCLNHPCFTLI